MLASTVLLLELVVRFNSLILSLTCLLFSQLFSFIGDRQLDVLLQLFSRSPFPSSSTFSSDLPTTEHPLPRNKVFSGPLLESFWKKQWSKPGPYALEYIVDYRVLDLMDTCFRDNFLDSDGKLLDGYGSNHADFSNRLMAYNTDLVSGLVRFEGTQANYTLSIKDRAVWIFAKQKSAGQLYHTPPLPFLTQSALVALAETLMSAQVSVSEVSQI